MPRRDIALMKNLTPMMQQYMKLKEQHKDCILFFRLGDFYEMFFDDAIVASKELEIALTGRDCGLKERAPMCGVPYHSAQNYIAKLVEKGYKVAICEQIEDPATARGIVKRDVVRIITPGTIVDTYMLHEEKNNYILSLYKEEKGVGISFADISTGELKTAEFTGKEYINQVFDEIFRIDPSEIITNIPEEDQLIRNKIRISAAYISNFGDWAFQLEHAEKKIKDHFQVLTLEGLGISDKPYAICATGALLEYLHQTQKKSLFHINKINYYTSEQYVLLDKSTRRNLELTETIRDKSKKGSLFWVLDKTNTAMGARTLRKWIESPLRDIHEIQYRLDAVEELKNNLTAREELKELLKKVYDLERLAGRISYGNANPRDLIALKVSLKTLPMIKEIVDSLEQSLFQKLFQNMDLLEEVVDLIEDSIIEDPPVSIKEGQIIKDSYNQELDSLREAITGGKKWIADLENHEKKATGIKSLKVGFNKQFGYYIEVTNSNLGLVPEHYIRKQTLVNSERYITPELKEVESKVLGAEDKIIDLEYKLFIEVRDRIKEFIESIQNAASSIAALDVLLSFAEVSDQFNYTKPIINDEDKIEISNGRHPVVERMMEMGMFIANDTLLDCDENRLLIITGPNMAGKSTYMRQVALIVLMAQAGCFVPADKAVVGVVDKIFTRVGASDDLAQGQSTFMVEMSELANILNNATDKSLVILDEVGRGTSTYDGLSIAWAVVEYFALQNRRGSRTLFATHYHELTELENVLKNVKNYCITVKEDEDDIIFLRKIVRGSIDKSYGIQVAKLAGVSDSIIQRAKEILVSLEEKDKKHSIKIEVSQNIPQNKKSQKDQSFVSESGRQMTLFDYQGQKIIEELKNIDILHMTPMEAMNCLYDLIKTAKGEDEKAI